MRPRINAADLPKLYEATFGTKLSYPPGTKLGDLLKRLEASRVLLLERNDKLLHLLRYEEGEEEEEQEESGQVARRSPFGRVDTIQSGQGRFGDGGGGAF